MANFNMSGPSSYISFFNLNAISRLSRRRGAPSLSLNPISIGCPGKDKGVPDSFPDFNWSLGSYSGGNAHSPLTTGDSLLVLRDCPLPKPI